MTACDDEEGRVGGGCTRRELQSMQEQSVTLLIVQETKLLARAEGLKLPSLTAHLHADVFNGWD